MQTVKELLDRIRWDEHLRQERFEVGYLDRVENKIIRVAFKELNFPSDDQFCFEVVDENEDVHSIPYHRVKEVYQNGKLIWHREH